MKAIVLNRHGELDAVALSSVPEPSIKPDEALVAMKAAALNGLDLWVMAGWRGLHLQFPHVMGSDGAGVVTEVGEEVSEFAPGDRVVVNPTLSCAHCRFCVTGRDNLCESFGLYGEHVPGFFAEYQAVRERNLLKIPDGVSFEVAAAASLVYVTAWHSLISAGSVQAGEDLLVVGAAGGVNTASIDIARFAGARTLIVVGSSEEKLEVARRLGADVTINRNREDWGKAVFRASDRQGVDVVVDNVGAATFQASLRALKKGGRLLTVGNTSGPVFDFDNRYIFGKHLRIIGSTMGPRQDYERVMDLVFRGKLTPTIGKIYPLSEGVTALRDLQEGSALGKLVLQI